MMRIKLNRPIPSLPVHRMKTYVVSSPVDTHTRPASCREVECRAYREGWTSIIPAGSDHEVTIRQSCAGRIDGVRRHFRERRMEGNLIRFDFPPGQSCFLLSKHRVPLERPEVFLVRGGDWRGSTGVIRRHVRPEHWVEDFAEHQIKLKRVVEG